jgi:thioester reductase-like protein
MPRTAKAVRPKPGQIVSTQCVRSEMDPGQTVSAQRAHSRMYRSGDLGRWRADGTIEYLGRNDCQVKLRGFRIELGEIESRLGQHPQVSSCAVVVWEERPGEKRLVAYYTGNEAVPSVEGLREHLLQQLPEYMVPSAFVRLEKLPLTANGKLDRKGLPAPDEGALVRRGYEEPQGEWERGIARIWQELLGVERVGRHENFFELGGHSLLAGRATSMMQKVLEVDVSLRDLFQHPVLADLAQAIALQDQEELPQALDFSAETALADEIVAAAPTTSPTAAPKNVLLTGATGFLGAFLLASLLEKTEATIHCLVRAGTEESARQRLLANLQSLDLGAKFIPQRVTVVPGDLGKPRLGLSDPEFRGLAELMDVIYHNGAWVHALHPYETLRAVNVGGTKEVVRLAGTGRYKTLHYVSTIDAIVPDNVLQSSGQTDEQSPWRQFRSLPSGYAQSKWVSERVLNVARSRGIPCTIYRPPYICGSTETGASNSTDFVSKLIDTSFRVGCVPTLEQSINMVPVDYISDSIVYLSMRPDTVGETYTLLHPQTANLNQLTRCLAQFNVPPLPELEASEWLDRCAVDQDTATIAGIIGSEQSEQIRWTEDLSQTIAGLTREGLPCPPIDADLMRRCIAWRLRKASAS